MVSVATSYTVQRYDDFCNKLDCPKYSVLKTAKDYQIRRYQSFKWASASSDEKILDYKEASRENFMKLFRYINGSNAQQQKVKMTAPVLTHIPVTQGPFCAPNFTMHFFMPYKFQDKPPTPLEDKDDVKIVELPEMTVYVGTFGGHITMDNIQTYGAALGKALMKDGIDFDYTQLFTAGYDAPYKLFNRHNEIMFLPTNNAFKV